MGGALAPGALEDHRGAPGILDAIRGPVVVMELELLGAAMERLASAVLAGALRPALGHGKVAFDRVGAGDDAAMLARDVADTIVVRNVALEVSRLPRFVGVGHRVLRDALTQDREKGGLA